MEKINVRISWSGNNYCAGTGEYNGVVLVTNKTLDGIKSVFADTFKFHIEGSVADGDVLPEYLVNGEYEFEYTLDAPALLHHFDGILTRAAISKASGINQRQLDNYISGKTEPRESQRRKVIEGLHKIAKEFSSVI